MKTLAATPRTFPDAVDLVRIIAAARTSEEDGRSAAVFLSGHGEIPS